MKVGSRRRGHKRGGRRSFARVPLGAFRRLILLRLAIWGVRLLAWGAGLALRRALRWAFRAALPRGLRLTV